jgi:hypothetical protein
MLGDENTQNCGGMRQGSWERQMELENLGPNLTETVFKELSV